jgi:ribulose-phosphate 3-epimerase
MNMKKIAPSILSADFSSLGLEIESVEKAGADWIHIDVMDGHFVPNITIGPPVVKSLRRISGLPFDVHLMIENPERYVESFAEAGSDIITVHIEAARHLNRTISLIKQSGKKAGISLNPATPLSAIEEILTDIDLLLIMSVNPGFGGQKFIPSMIPKLRRAKKMVRALSPDVLIEVDGGVGIDNIEMIAEAGADIFVAGSSVFTSGNYEKAIREMKAKANSSGISSGKVFRN